MIPVPYLMSAVFVLACGGLVFRGLVRSQYRRHGRLPWWASLAQLLVFSIWAYVASTQLPAGWPDSHVHGVPRAVGWILFGGGVVGTLLAGLDLGVGESFGIEPPALRATGLYRMVRNPQAAAFGVAMVGHMIVWPTWRLGGILILYFPIVHLMVLTEEEHLRRSLGDEYRQYEQRVSRYLPRIRRAHRPAT